MEELFKAINKDDVAAIEDLVKNQGVDINGNTPKGFTFLTHAIVSKKRNSFDKLLELGVDINAPSGQNKSTALMFASYLEDEGNYFTQKLLEKGADVNIQNSSGLTALMVAYDKVADFEIIDMILNANPNLELEDIKKETALFYAVRRAQMSNYPETIEDLFKDGRAANVNHQNIKGYTALHLAVSLDDFDNSTDEIVDYLLTIPGINPNIQEERGNTPLMLCVLENSSLAIFEELIKVTDIEIKNKENNTALLLSLVPGIHPSYAEILLDAGVNVNVQNSDGDTPLILAIREGFPGSLIANIVESGADLNAKNEQEDTALHEIIYAEKDPDFIKLLIDNGADINPINDDTKTPLMYAAIEGLDSHVKLLLELGADKTIKDLEGKTALDYAKEMLIAYPRDEMLYKSIIQELGSAPQEMWKGYTKSDADFFNPILDNENNLNDQSICPFCLQYTERESACKYMKHKCRPELRHERLYNLYRSSDGYVVWCAVCGRHCYGHGHFPLTNTTETVRPNLLPFKPGADVYDPKSCSLEGGGGPDEKIRRIDGLLRYICEVQEDVGKRSAKKVREELIEEAWKAAGSRAPETVRDIRAAKKFNIPCGLPSATTVEPVAEVSTDIPNPNPLPVKHENAECVVELGVHDDGRPVYEFKHVQPDGSIFNHNDQYICAQDLEELLRNAGGMEDKCPIDLDNCKGKLHPDELKEIYGENSDVYKNYRDRFNEKNKVGGKKRKQSRRRTYRNKKFRGGADGPGIVSKMTDASCALPEKKTAGRRTYKKKPKSRRVTKRHI